MVLLASSVYTEELKPGELTINGINIPYGVEETQCISGIKGNANSDNNVDVYDLLEMFKILQNGLTGEVCCCCIDLNNDNIVNTLDMTKLLSLIQSREIISCGDESKITGNIITQSPSLQVEAYVDEEGIICGNKGDLNNDNKVDIFDLLKLLKALSDIVDYNENENRCADLKVDEKIDVFDLIEMLKLLGEGTKKCADSDVTKEYTDGKNPYKKGTVDSSGQAPWTDECSSSTRLLEVWCRTPESDKSEGYYVDCQNGCEDGACIDYSAEIIEEGVKIKFYPRAFSVGIVYTFSQGANTYVVYLSRLVKKDDYWEYVIPKEKYTTPNELWYYFSVSFEEGQFGEIYGKKKKIFIPPTPPPISISIATLKDTYFVGESIELTDPPDELDFNDNKMIGNSINNIQINQEIKDYVNIDEESFKKSEYEGYIIQFKEKPVLEKKVELNKLAEINEKSKLKKVVSLILPAAVEPVLPENIDYKLGRHRQLIIDEHNNIKQKISSKIGKNLITGNVAANQNSDIEVLDEYNDVFNGIALDISDSEAKELEELDEVERVYPNYEVHANLMDSVPLINADKLWQLDIDGNNCEETGKPCLTGEGVTIAIIDTGIDYTHPDLSGIFCTEKSYCDGDGYCGDGVIDTCLGEECDCGGDGVCSEEPTAENPRGELDGKTCSDMRTNPSEQIGALSCYPPDSSFACRFNAEQCGQVAPPDNIPPDNINLIYEGLTPANADSYGNVRVEIDLGEQINCKVIGGYDFINRDNDPMDDMGHGTHVAATAAGNGILKGVAPDAKLVAYKVLDNYGSGSSGGIIAAIERSVDPNQDGDFSDHIDVISLSLGGPGNPDDPNSQAIDTAVKNGVVAVIAAGNNGPVDYSIGSPGTARKAITVGASYKKDYEGQYWGDLNPRADQITDFSSVGPVVWPGGGIVKPDIVAPGAVICAAQWGNAFAKKGTGNCNNDDEHVAISGTSMATPHVAGAVALIKQAHPDWKPEEIKGALKSTAIDLGEPISKQGYGRIDIMEALKSAKPPIAELYQKEIWYDDNLEIIGTAIGDDFVKYNLYYGKGIDPQEWIMLTESYSQVDNSVLYQFDPSFENDKVFTIRLVVENKESVQSEDRIILYDRKLNKDRWPFKPEISGVISFWPNSISDDINNDGDKEIIAVMYVDASFKRQIFVIDSDGKLADGWPIILENDGTMLISDPSTGDIKGEGYNEIILVNGKKVYAWDYRGNLLDGWPVELPLDSVMGGRILTVLADLNYDKRYEIIIAYPTSSGYSFFVLNDEGGIENYWKITSVVGDNYNALYALYTLAVADINNERQIIFVDPWEFKLYIWDSFGYWIEGFPKKISAENPKHYGQLIIADVDNDLNKDIITHNGTDIFIIDPNGDVTNNWPIKSFIEQIVVGDVNKDGDIEIIVSDSRGFIYVFSNRGELIKKKSLFIPYFMTTPLVIGDVNNDGYQDIVFGRGYNGIFAYDHNLNPIYGFPLPTDSFLLSSPILDDLENDGKLDIVGGEVLFADKMYAFNADEYNKDLIDWPMFQHDPQHTGCYGCKKDLRPQSKIKNNGKSDIKGTLTFYIEDSNNVRKQIYQSNELTINPGEKLGLDTIFNPLEYSINEAGNYKIIAVFETEGNVYEANYDFKVEGDN